MIGTNRQIAELATQGLTAPEIAESLSISVEEVATALVTDKNIVRVVGKAEHNKLVAGIENLQDLALEGVKKILMYGENESAIMRASEFVLEHGLGLKEPPKAPTTNIVVLLNERLQQVKARRREMENVKEAEVVLA